MHMLKRYNCLQCGRRVVPQYFNKSNGLCVRCNEPQRLKQKKKIEKNTLYKKVTLITKEPKKVREVVSFPCSYCGIPVYQFKDNPNKFFCKDCLVLHGHYFKKILIQKKVGRGYIAKESSIFKTMSANRKIIDDDWSM